MFTQLLGKEHLFVVEFKHSFISAKGRFKITWFFLQISLFDASASVLKKQSQFLLD